MNKADALIIVNLFADLVLLAQVFIAIFVIILFLRMRAKKSKMLNGIVQFLSSNSLIFAFFVALFAMFGSLFFSEIALFTPCKLCWYQRICMYPQVLILGIAAVKNDFAVRRYILPLSIIGLIIAVYHYVLQTSKIPLPCTDQIADCALKQIQYFGYMTIPVMSATAFALIIIFMLITKKK